MQRVLRTVEGHEKSDDDRGHGDTGKIECNQLGSDGGTDICTHDQTDRLSQIEQTGIDETDDHDR